MAISLSILTFGKNDVLRTQAIYLDDQGKKIETKECVEDLGFNNEK